MSNPRVRGLVIFGIILVVAIVACGLLPFVWLPSAGLGIALPVIAVPGEVLSETGWFGSPFVNTMTSVLFADFMVLLFAFLAWRASKGWTKEVPGRFQSLVESIVEMLYNFLRGVGGDRLRTTKRPVPLWPLAATIFLFLLAANLSKLFPGFESVGNLHCAHVGYSGYPIINGWTDNSARLWVDAPLNAGVDQTEETEHACDEFFHGFGNAYPTGFPNETAEEIEANVEEYEARVAELQAAGEESLDEAARLELEQKEYYVRYAPDRLEALEHLEPLNEEIEALDSEIAELEALAGEHAEAGDHGEEETHEEGEAVENVGEGEGGVGTEGEGPGGAASTDEAVEGAETDVTEEPSEEGVAEPGDELAEPPSSEEQAAQGGDEDADEDIAVLEGEPVSEEDLEAELQEEQLQELAAPTTEEQLESVREQRDILITERNLALSEARYPHATLPLSEEQLERGVIPYIFHITPFFRGAATDLSLTFAFAIMAMVLVQAYGVAAQGPAYFEKFVNISALGNLNKKPLGAIDFVVGLIEIISEIGKIVSLAFRLFGNLFAGGVALLAITFLVSLLVPGIIYGLELIIGTVQALVFAVLTVVFSVQAMEAHHGDEDHHEGEDHTGGHGQGEHHHEDMPVESTGEEISTGQNVH
jgi:F0F1-type ATP synthase membrane subunit a